MNPTLQQQRIAYFAGLALCVGLLILGEANAFADWCVAPDSQAAYTLEIVGIFAMLAALPAAIKLRGLLRTVLVVVCGAVVIVCNYLTLSPYAVLCLGIVAFALLYCYPRQTSGKETEKEAEKTSGEASRND